MATTDADLAKLSVQLELQTAAFEAGVKQVDRQLKKMEDNTKKSSRGIDLLNKSVSKLGKSFAGLAGAVTLGALAQQSKEAIEFADSIAKTADKVGVTTSELQELRFAAGQAGIETRTLDMALQRFARRMGEAATGTGELLKTTQELGIEFQDEDGRFYTTTELLVQYADAMGKAETQQEKLRLAFKAFDSEGAALVNLLGSGSEEMQALREQAVELGLVLSEDLTRQAEVINDKFEIFTTQIKVGLTEAFITATAAALEFFDVFSETGAAERRLAEIDAEIERLREKLSKGRYRGSARDAQLLQAEIEKRKEVQAQLDALREAEEARANQATATASVQLTQAERLAQAYRAQLNPLIPLGEEIEKIQSAVGNGLSQAEAWELITKAVEKYNKAITDAAEKSGDVKEDFDELIKGINQSFDRIANNPPLPDDFLSEIGVDLKEVTQKSKDELDEILQAVNGFARDFTNTLVDALKTGELAFDDFAKNVLETIVKMMLNDIFTQFFELIYGGIKSYFGFGTAPTTAPTSVIPQDGMTRAAGTSTAMVGMVQGYAAPRSYDSKSRVTVNVNNYGNDEVNVTERQDSNGGIDIDILIKSKVSSGFARGDYDKVMGSAFGIRRLGY